MATEPESGTITLRSTRVKKSTDGGDAVFFIAIFSSPPLKFVAMFEVKFFHRPGENFLHFFYVQIKSSIYGDKIRDVVVSNGLISIKHDHKVAIYSLDAVLNKVMFTN
jgi:hypothetical protein